MTAQKINLCARAYIEYYRAQFAQYGWAHDYAEGLIEADAFSGLSFVVEVLNMCTHEEELAYVASSLLEDLLSLHVVVLQPQLEDLLQSEKQFCLAMKYVWAKDNTPLHKFLSGLPLLRGVHEEVDSAIESSK